jgi:outer membrane receptor for ferrienterochelin and colicins
MTRGRSAELLTMHVVGAAALAAAFAIAGARPADAQSSNDSIGAVVVSVVHDSRPLELAVVRAGLARAQTDAGGRATLRLMAGTHTVVAARLGYRPDSAMVLVRAGSDTSITISLEPQAAEIEAVVVSATRSERRVEDVPLRVEVIDEEEIAEKVAMTPGDIAMMLNETSGLRVQTTSPSLGGANVRIQGLVGRYSLLLADGLPLYGGQAGGLGLLQIPPLDLGRVEIIKGTASALYGASALGGVVNLLSRRPGDAAEHTALVNQTSRDGTDAVAFLSAPLSARWGYTLLAGGHRQSRRDVDGDGWTDVPGYERVVARPRFYFEDGEGRTAFLTAGFTGESRRGGTLAGRVAPDGQPFLEGLGTRRADVGALARWVMQDSASILRGAILTVRGSAVEQRHAHDFGTVREDDRHRTWFAEAALAAPRGRVTLVGGAAIQQESYRAEDVPGFDYTFTVPALFAQADVDAARWLSLSASGRLDAHSEYGSALNPRVSLLFRGPTEGALAGWTGRLSVGTGEFAPTPFTEETEATGLTPLTPLWPAPPLAPVSPPPEIVVERATSRSLDVGGPLETALGHLELNATAFGSRVQHPLQVIDAGGTTASGARGIRLVNATEPTRTWGVELLGRLVRELGETRVDGEEAPALRVTGTYTYLRSTGCDAGAGANLCERREVPLTPRHAVGVVAAVEQHDRGRVGLEVYYTGRQRLDENPYRTESRPYVVLGMLGERAFETTAGTARVFVNLENLTNVRQTRYDPLVLPSRGRGGRWTTDAWTELAGFTVNGGVRFAF